MEELEERGLRRALQSLQDQQGEVAKALQEATVQLARLDERQQETSKKVDAISLALNNHYVGSLEFAMLRQRVDDYIRDSRVESARVWVKLDEVQKDFDVKVDELTKARDNDRLWFIRTTIAGAVSVCIALFLTWVGAKK